MAVVRLVFFRNERATDMRLSPLDLVGASERGDPTAHATEALAPIFGTVDPYVWPGQDDDVVGQSLELLYRGAHALRERCPETYRLLTLFDALRVGQAREKNVARDPLKQALKTPAAAACVG